MAQMIGGNTVNWQQQEVPFSRFGTRKVAWFKVGYADTKSYNAELDVYQLDQVQFNRMISIVQSQAEVVMTGAPEVRNNFGKFMIAVFEDTLGNGDLTDPGEYYYNNKSLTLQDVLRDISGDGNLTVERLYMSGAPAESDYSTNNGWTDDDSRREYDRKSDFLMGYTQD